MTETPQVWDVNLALDRLGGDRELLVELAEIFLDSLPEQLRKLRDGLDNADAEKVGMAAHSLKGSVGSFAAEPARQAALELEKLAREGKLDAAADALTRLTRQLAALEDSLRRELDSGAGH
jgi:HPt (histidine-containing phosphotransfer) domain-containing protein